MWNILNSLNKKLNPKASKLYSSINKMGVLSEHFIFEVACGNGSKAGTLGCVLEPEDYHLFDIIDVNRE